MARLEAKDELLRYAEAKSIRSPLETDWRMCAAYCAPRHFSKWQTDGQALSAANMDAVRRFAFDSTGVNALPKFVAILQRLCTPASQRWHKLTADNTDLMKVYSVRKYFDELNETLFKMRYTPRAMFAQAAGETYRGIGLYGTGPLSLTWRKPTRMDPRGGFKYKAWHLKDIFLLTDDDGVVVAVYRRFFMNARQYKIKFGSDGAPRAIATELGKAVPSETNFFEFVQVLSHKLEEDYDPEAIDNRRHPIRESYIAVQDQQYVGEERGYGTMPIMAPRVDTEAGDVYGYSPAQQGLPALGSLNAMKKTVLKQGHQAVQPTLLAADDGVLSGRVDLRPGHVNYGALNSQGQKLLQTLETGNFTVAEKILEGEREDVKDSFLVSLFTILAERPEMTATQVIEESGQVASLLAPSMGRLQSEMLGPQIEREIDLLSEHGMAPEMPQEMIDAEGAYNVVYTSPMAKGQFSEEIAGYLRLKETILAQVQATGDPSPADWLNDDAALPEIAHYMSVRTAWVNDADTVKQKRKDRADQQQQSEILKQAPAIAAVAKEGMKTSGGVPGVSN